MSAWAFIKAIRRNRDGNVYAIPEFTAFYGKVVAGVSSRTSGALCRGHILEGLPEGARVLEVGAGVGEDALALARLRPDVHVVASDLHAIMLDQARSKPTPQNLDWVHAGADALPFPAGHFDAVYSANTVKHFTDAHQTLGRLLRMLRPGGVLSTVELSPWARWRTWWNMTRMLPIPWPLRPVLTVKLRREMAVAMPDRGAVEGWFRGQELAREDGVVVDELVHPELGAMPCWGVRMVRG